MKNAKPVTPDQAIKRQRTSLETTPNSSLGTGVLKQTLSEVERDEAEAISLLCSLLECVETSRDFRALTPIRDVVKEWQMRPPRGIVTDLVRIGETLKCQAHDKA